MKRFTSLLLAAVFIVMSFPLASAEENGSFFKADAALISEYFKAIGEQDHHSRNRGWTAKDIPRHIGPAGPDIEARG